MLSYCDLKLNPKSPEGLLLLDSPLRKDEPKYSPEFGSFAEIVLHDKLFQLAKSRDFGLTVDDNADVTEYHFSRMTYQDMQAVRETVSKVIQQYEQFKAKKSGIDVKPRDTNYGILAGPSLDSEEELRILKYILPCVGLDCDNQAFTEQFAGGREEFKKMLLNELRRDPIKEAVGPHKVDSSEFTDVPSYIVTLKLTEEASSKIKDQIAKDIRFFENKWKVEEKQGIASANDFIDWMGKVGAKSNCIASSTDRYLIRRILAKANVLERFPREAKALGQLLIRAI